MSTAQKQFQGKKSRRKRKHATHTIKLVVTGLHGSGKSSFIRTISQYTEWQAEPGNSWFFGRVRVDRHLLLHFLEPPMDRQFDFMWLREVISRIRATGYVLLIDSSKPQHFGEFLSIVYTIRGFHESAPLAIAANKQDSPYAWSAEDIQLGLGLRDFAVLPCIATDVDPVRNVCIELLHQSLGDKS